MGDDVQHILVNVTLDEVRIVCFSAGGADEIHAERCSAPGLTGNIYCGRVRRLLPGLQAVFVEVGMARPGFLQVGKEHALSPFSVGMRLPVQVSCDPLDSKGARLSASLNLPGRLLILTPGQFRTSVSRKLIDESESERLRSLVPPDQAGGYIVRTAAAGAPPEALQAEQQHLQALWHTLHQRFSDAHPGECLYAEPGPELRLLRDRPMDPKTTRILVDDRAVCKTMQDWAAIWFPALVDSIHFHDSDDPLFGKLGAEKVFQQALMRRVSLPSGGHLVFDQTEAMTTIDVNSGSSLSIRRAPDVPFRTNFEAVAVIAREVCLRNLGGIIIIDFIDMPDPALNTALLAALEKAFVPDTAHTTFGELTRLGLVQMTRRRNRKSLTNAVCEPCPLCQRRGMIRSPATVGHEIIRELYFMKHCDGPAAGYRVQLAPEVARFIETQAADLLPILTERLGRTVEFCSDVHCTREKWHIFPLPG